MIYISIYIWLTIWSLLASGLLKFKISFNGNIKFTGKQFYLIGTFLTLTLIMAMRDLTIGKDTDPYTRIFTVIANSNTLKESIINAPLTAPIYVFICRIVSYFSRDPRSMIIVSSLFVNGGLIIYIKRISKNLSLSTFCWIGLTLFYFSMNGNRQSMALVLIMNALIYLNNNLSSKKGWCLIIIAVGIHSTCLIITIAIAGIYLTNIIHDNRLIFVIALFGSTIISLLFNVMIIIFVKIFPWYAIYSNGTSKYSIFKSTGGGRIVVLYIFLFVICLLWLNKNMKYSIGCASFHSRIYPALIFCTIFGMFNCRNELINRMLLYFIVFFISFIPETIQQYNKKSRILLATGIVFVLFLYSIFSLIENQNGVVPYTVFLH